MQYIISQLIGAAGLISSLLSFQQKDRKRIMIFQMTASFLFAVQLFLLGAVTGCVVDLISFARTLIFSQNTKKKWAASRFWLYGFLAAMLLAGIATWDNIFSILPIAGSMLSTIALWMKEGKKIRRISLFVGPCWFIYCVINGSVTGALNELIAMTSIVIGMIRYDRSRSESQKREENS